MFENIIKLVGKENTLVIHQDMHIQDKSKDYNFYNKKKFQGFNTFDLLKSIFNDF